MGEPILTKEETIALTSLLKKLLEAQPAATATSIFSAKGRQQERQAEKENLDLRALNKYKSANALIPAEIFGTELAPAESLVKYLKENIGLNYHEIGLALSRDERGIWGTYSNAKKKMPEKLPDYPESRHTIPLTDFSDRKQSILSAAISHLHYSQEMRFADIAKLLKKAYSTIYTTHLKKEKNQGAGEP